MSLLKKKVHVHGHELVPGLVAESRILSVAQKVTDVFKLYEKRFHALDEELVKFGLTNKGHELVLYITRAATNADNSLEHFDSDRSAALDRADASGAIIEVHLDSLEEHIRNLHQTYLDVKTYQNDTNQPTTVNTSSVNDALLNSNEAARYAVQFLKVSYRACGRRCTVERHTFNIY